MFRWKDAGGPTPQGIDESEDYASSNMKMLVIAAAFLVVTIGLILIQPGPVSEPVQEVADASLVEGVIDEGSEVTRADASLLDIQALSASEAVSQRLRQPIRLTDTDARHTDLRSLTSAVLIGFGHDAGAGDRLQALLVQALTEGQSNAYIDALLNTAAARGEFAMPRQLTTTAGRLDTETLLLALVRQSQG